MADSLECLFFPAGRFAYLIAMMEGARRKIFVISIAIIKLEWEDSKALRYFSWFKNGLPK